MSADIDELRALEAAATEGPWRFEPEGDSECGEPACCSEHWDNRIWGGGVVIAESHLTSHADAELIAAMRNALPELLDAAEERDRLRVQIARLADDMERGRWPTRPRGGVVDDLRALLDTSTPATGGGVSDG